MNLSYFQKKIPQCREPESLEWRTLPQSFYPWSVFLSSLWVGQWCSGGRSFLLESHFTFYSIVLTVIGRGSGEQTRVGRLLDSACDKITAMGLFGVAIWLALFPLWVVAPILLCCVVQFGMAGWAWVCGRHRSGRLPTTYLYRSWARRSWSGFPLLLCEYSSMGSPSLQA